MIRKTLGKSIGAVVLGLSLAEDVQAQNTGYLDLSQAESFRLVHERAKSVSYDTWKPQVLDYDGAVLVLFNSNCNTTENADTIDRNLNLVYLQLMDKFVAAKVNDLPLKFATFNVCGRSKADLLGVNDSETHMYLDGKEIDRVRGGPLTEKGINSVSRSMSYWIDYTLLGKRLPEDKDRDIILLYKGNFPWEEFPRSVLNQ